MQSLSNPNHKAVASKEKSGKPKDQSAPPTMKRAEASSAGVPVSTTTVEDNKAKVPRLKGLPSPRNGSKQKAGKSKVQPAPAVLKGLGDATVTALITATTAEEPKAKESQPKAPDLKPDAAKRKDDKPKDQPALPPIGDPDVTLLIFPLTTVEAILAEKRQPQAKAPQPDASKQTAEPVKDQPAPPAAQHQEHKTIDVPVPKETVEEIKAEERRLLAMPPVHEQLSSTNDLTEPIEKVPLDLIGVLKTLAGRPDSLEYMTYRPLPSQRGSKPAAGPVWRIELHSFKLGPRPVGIDVVGDLVIGRGPDVDLDLAEYKGNDFGVSRRHAMFRPTNNHLYLIDLGSMNGTHCNMIPLGKSITYALHDADVITLGKFNMTIKIIKAADSD